MAAGDYGFSEIRDRTRTLDDDWQDTVVASQQRQEVPHDGWALAIAGSFCMPRGTTRMRQSAGPGCDLRTRPRSSCPSVSPHFGRYQMSCRPR